VLVTPDGERTMNTYLGAAQDLHPNDIDADAVAAAQVTYLEGYLWDPPHAKEAFLKAAKIAHGAERDVALTLSDAFCVDRYRAEFLDLIRTGHRRPRVRQRARAAQPVPEPRISTPRSTRCATMRGSR
jgi:adenosine kinase